jgi:hypothetical protein
MHNRRGWDLETNLDTAAPALLDDERSVDQHGTLTHATQPSMLLGRAVEAATVVADAKNQASGVAFEGDRDPGGFRMTCDIGQALLGDAVDGELLVLREPRQLRVELPVDANAGHTLEPAGELGQRADKAELLEHFRAQLARDSPYLVESPADSLPGVVDLGLMRGFGFGDRIQLE